MTTGSVTTSAPLEGSWQLEASDVQGVEKALVALRKQYGSAAAAKEGHAGTRNSVANLVVYAASAEDAEPATTTLSQLAGAHPSRTILLIADLAPDAPDVRASVSAACHMDHGRRICYEEIRLNARGHSGPHLRSIIDPLLISDLPVFLWWTGDPPFRDEIFLTLARLSHHIVIDSAQFHDPASTLARLGQLIADGSVSATVHDLNWLRLAAWRELLAQLFDPPAMADLLPHIRQLRIVRATRDDGARASPPQSLLLAGWLATRLDWGPGRSVERNAPGADRLRLRNPGGEFVIELSTEVHPEARPGDLQSVQVVAKRGEHTATLTLTRSADQEHAWTGVAVGGTPSQERSVNFRTASDAELLSDVLETLEPDPAFEEAVEMAGRLAALLPATMGR